MACWFITGCSTGIGREIASAALEAGHSVAVTARNIGSVADFADRFGDRALVLPLDVTNHEQITAAVSAAESAFGGIDVLVNNAGYGYMAAVERVSGRSFRRRQTSSPETCGIIQSSKIRSGRPSATRSIASSPFDAATT